MLANQNKRYKKNIKAKKISFRIKVLEESMNILALNEFFSFFNRC